MCYCYLNDSVLLKSQFSHRLCVKLLVWYRVICWLDWSVVKAHFTVHIMFSLEWCSSSSETCNWDSYCFPFFEECIKFHVQPQFPVSSYFDCHFLNTLMWWEAAPNLDIFVQESLVSIIFLCETLHDQPFLAMWVHSWYNWLMFGIASSVTFVSLV